MMPSDRTSSPDRSDWLDALLAADAAETQATYLADDGFTARVLAALPGALARPGWRKPAVVALWGAAVAGLAVATPDTLLGAVREGYRLVASMPVSLPGLAGAVGVMLVLTGAAAAYTLRDE